MKKKRTGNVPDDATGTLATLSYFDAETEETEAWDLYERQSDGKTRRLKLVASGAGVAGKSNYSLNATRDKLTGSGDYTRLKQTRPELLDAVQDFLSGAPAQDSLAGAEDDPYGDMVTDGGLDDRNLSPDQRFRSAMADRRLYYWHVRVTNPARKIDPAMMVNAMYRGEYKRDPDPEALEKWVGYLSQHAPGCPDKDAILEIHRAYWADEYKPREHELLDANLDFALGVAPESFQPESETVSENETIFTDAVKNGETVNNAVDFSELL